MQEIDLGDEVKFNIKYKGQSYTLREPTVDEVENLKDTPNMVDFLAKLGMPSNVTKGLGISKCRQIVDGMLDLVGKKK